jgi:hypothetical protein
MQLDKGDLDGELVSALLVFYPPNQIVDDSRDNADVEIVYVDYRRLWLDLLNLLILDLAHSISIIQRPRRVGRTNTGYH